MNEKPIKTGLESISCDGGTLGCQEACKNALEGDTCGEKPMSERSGRGECTTCPKCGSTATREELTVTRDGVTTREVWLRCNREPNRKQTAALRFGKWTRCPIIKEAI